MTAKKKTRKKASAQPSLLAGGNPKIAKADGDAPVQEYIAAMPGWKSDVGRHLDGLIGRTVPDVKKAVRWNTPFYGVEGRGWFLALYCYKNHVEVTFLMGSSLQPLPPVESKQEHARYLHIHEGEDMDEAQMVSWIRQASEQDGEHLFQ